MSTCHTAESRNSMAQAVMLGECPYSRAAKRKFVRLPAWVIFYRNGRKKHVAMVRDMSRQGIFFYSKWTNTAPIACKGIVVRVENPVPGAAIGIAISLTRFAVLK